MTARDTVNQLIGSQLAESGDLSYKTRVKADRVYIHNRDRSLSPEDKSATVEWEMELEARTWGVKDISVYVTKVEAAWVWEDQDKNEPTKSEPTRLAWTPSSKDGWAVQVDYSERKLPFSLFPIEVSIYLLEKKIVVTF